MEVFTLDVCSRTQDFMLYNSKENPRNYPRAILPSPTVIVGRRIRELANAGKNILLKGYTMGGGECVSAIKEAVKKVKVFAFEKPALTINDDIEKVRRLGIEIVDEDVAAEVVVMKDVFLEDFEKFLGLFGVEIPELIAVAVQDHGFSPKVSNRIFRFTKIREMLEKDCSVFSLIFGEKNVPEEFNRMKSVIESVKDYAESVGRDVRVFVADTSFAAISGCYLAVKEFPALLINFGNSHTVGAVVNREGEILSLFEHHTSVVAKMDFHEFVKKFLRGEITNEDVVRQGGHGALVKEVAEVREILATGPNAKLFGFREVAPLGDVMTVGNAGLVKMLEENDELAGV